jgi:hypothetical protein
LWSVGHRHGIAAKRNVEPGKITRVIHKNQKLNGLVGWRGRELKIKRDAIAAWG